MSKIIRLSLLACALMAATQGVSAAEKFPVPKANSPEATVRSAVESMVNPDVGVKSVTKTTYGGMYEVVLGNDEIVYTDAGGSFFITGALYDIKTRKNVTQARTNELSLVDIADLPLEQAVKQVRGNGQRVLVTFEDPNCGYCKKLAKDLVDVKDTTIYTFMVPILSPDSQVKADAIWCSKDRMKAWNDWMTEGKAPSAAKCETPTEKNIALTKKLRISGTPTMYLADGNRLGGYLPPAELEKAMAAADKSKNKYVAKAGK